MSIASQRQRRGAHCLGVTCFDVSLYLYSAHLRSGSRVLKLWPGQSCLVLYQSTTGLCVVSCLVLYYNNLSLSVCNLWAS